MFCVRVCVNKYGYFLQVLSEALKKSGQLRTQNPSLSSPFSLDILTGLREEIRIVKEETAIVQDQLDTLLKEVAVRHEEIERAKESISHLLKNNEKVYDTEDSVVDENQDLTEGHSKTERCVVNSWDVIS